MSRPTASFVAVIGCTAFGWLAGAAVLDSTSVGAAPIGIGRPTYVVPDPYALCAGITPHPGSAVTFERVTTEVEYPMQVVSAPLDVERLFVVEQTGLVWIFRNGVRDPRPFLDISSEVNCCANSGLFTIAFHPLWRKNGAVFLSYATHDDQLRLARVTIGNDPDHVDAATLVPLFDIQMPHRIFFHWGGQIAFGHDGYLYMSVGDGGELEKAQRDDLLVGKVLRFDVDQPGPPHVAVPPANPRASEGLPWGLIWAKGLRNPWRFSFDRANGDFYLGDVGRQAWEEIDWVPRRDPGGHNFGWPIFEGEACFQPPPPGPDCPDHASFRFPVLTYSHDDDDGNAVMAGFVYRGCALPALRGRFFYSDYNHPWLRSFVLRGGAAVDRREDMPMADFARLNIEWIDSFGEDARGELYLVQIRPEAAIWKMVPRQP